MGHTRLGTIPKSRKWVGVVATLAGEEGQAASAIGLAAEDVPDIAELTLDAAQVGLEKAADDLGLRYTFYLLTQIVLAAREEDWLNRLAVVGVELSNDSTLFDLTVEMQAAIDDYIFSHGRPTDVSEMAQQAAGESVAALAKPRTITLFGNDGDELRAAMRELSTRKGFSDLGQRFFGIFMSRYLNFYLSRITASYLGSQRLPQIGDISEFNIALQVHCTQSAKVVRDFCGQWYSKTEFQEGINLQNTTRFIYVALRKLSDEMKRQQEES